jgi:hypothetical protein
MPLMPQPTASLAPSGLNAIDPGEATTSQVGISASPVAARTSLGSRPPGWRTRPTSTPVAESHSLRMPSKAPVTIRPPSGANAAARTTPR